jgi:CheY-like chemotaxis protein
MREPVKGGAAGNKTVLVVEDSQTQAMHLQALLAGQGLRVLVAGDGPEGLEKARECGPDIILLDLELPTMSGFEVCKSLKEERGTADIPVIMFTRYDDQAAVIQGFQTGAVEYIPKDAFADAVLLETLRQMRLIHPQSGRV